MAAGLKERETVKSAFARYVSRQVMDKILDFGVSPEVHGDRHKITVLFSNIRGFTTLSEQMRPEGVVALLNEYFERMVEVVYRNHGTLDKFLGDGMMVIFGAPEDDPYQEEHALQAALEMREELHKRGHPLGRARRLQDSEDRIGAGKGTRRAGGYLCGRRSGVERTRTLSRRSTRACFRLRWRPPGAMFESRGLI